VTGPPARIVPGNKAGADRFASIAESRLGEAFAVFTATNLGKRKPE
jgi:hypothetical protein